MKNIAPYLLSATLAFGAPACAGELTISGAASLTDAFNELKAIFEKEHPGTTINTNYAASNPLLKQIMEGAPADIFASADQETMDKASDAKAIDPESRKNFAANDLVLIVPKKAEKPETLAELAKLQKIAIGDPDSVPAGRYARAALEKAGLWEKLQPAYINSASVRQALDYVARGEADAGFVYKTDALKQKDKVDIDLVATGHEPITYPIAIVSSSANPKTAQAFIDFILSPRGQAILAEYGFSRP